MKRAGSPLRLAPDKLRWTCDAKKLPSVSSAARPSLEIIGQERALDALRMGLDIRLPGYHLFVTGTEGTGRTTTIRRVLEEHKKRDVQLEDLCYVFNFDNPEAPVLLRFPAGKGRDFAKRMERMISSLRRHIPQLYRGDQYAKKISRLESHYRQTHDEAVRAFSEKARHSGFTVVEAQSGPYIRPELRAHIEDEEYEIADLDLLVEEGRLDARIRDRFQNRYTILSEELQTLMRSNSRLEESFREELQKMAEAEIRPLIHDTIEILKSRFEFEMVHDYLDNVETALIDETWVRDEEEQQEDTEEPFYRYWVNVVVDNSRQEGMPVIIETSPTFQNLFGNIEMRQRARGASPFDYRQIRAGCLAQAQGGTLVIMAQDLLEEGPVWPTLKRVLRHRKLQIQGYDPQNRMVISPLKPEAIELDVKVILVGDTMLYTALLQDDPDLQRVFRIKVDFDTDMPRNRNNMRRYISFINKVQTQDQLLPVTAAASAAVLEFGARLSGRKDRLSTRFSSIVDVLIESDYFARKEKAARIDAKHVDRTLDERIRRLGQSEQHFLKAVREGIMLLDTGGEAVGQVNGLFVLEQWDYAYGQPVRVTASTSLGDGDILSIEREVELSGSSFDKGHMILAGFLRHRFAQDKPLSLDAAISCEQNYIAVDGDSASATEIFALLSALADLPASQSLAVTGSVNQFGEIQPVGGVNHKVEGFFRVCRELGLNGEQGVIIPAANVRNLMLDKEVVASCREGKFHVYAIKTVDQGLELLTGVKAGRRRKDGSWSPDSVNDRVNRRLHEMAMTAKRFGDGAKQAGAGRS